MIEATQWFQNGDHPQDESTPLEESGEATELSEGKVVQHFHSPDLEGNEYCPQCGNRMQRHGVLNGEEFVCPGDYIVTDRQGVHRRVSRGEFESHNEPYVRPPRFADSRLSDLEERKQSRPQREGV